MAISAMYTLAAVNLNKDSDVLFNQVTNQRISPGISRVLAGSDGEVDARYVAIAEQRPTIGFTTTALKTALDIAALNGRELDVDDGTNGGALEFFFQKLAEGGTRAGAGNDIKMTINEGILVPRTLRASQGGIAQLDYDAVATYDGTNEPIVIATAQSVPTTTPGVAALWTLGPISVNGTPVNGVTDITLDFGISLAVEGSDGEVWPRFVAISARAPSISFTTPDAGLFNTIGLDGLAQSATDSVVYFRKLAEGGTRVAAATEEHISFTIDEGIITVDDVSGGHGGTQMLRATITPTYDGTNAVLVLDTTAAIS